ncbi:hypothetical protein ACNKHK_16945 [Shigella flexneri]
MVVAKTSTAQTRLVSHCRGCRNYREYEAVAIGHMTAGGTVDEEPISRHPTKRTRMADHPDGETGGNALSHYGNSCRVHTRLRLRLETGRHRIRVHMAHITHPLSRAIRSTAVVHVHRKALLTNLSPYCVSWRASATCDHAAFVSADFRYRNGMACANPTRWCN